ncbi:hypothetical protein EV1_008689 [Malus domestica]
MFCSTGRTFGHLVGVILGLWAFALHITFQPIYFGLCPFFFYYPLMGFIQMSPKDKKNKSHHSEKLLQIWLDSGIAYAVVGGKLHVKAGLVSSHGLSYFDTFACYPDGFFKMGIYMMKGQYTYLSAFLFPLLVDGRQRFRIG